jgi:hypothetical protein
MRKLFLITLSLTFFSCNHDGNTHHRSYVISTSHEPALEVEDLTNSPCELDSKED